MRKSKEVRRAEFKKALIDRLKSLIAPVIVLALVAVAVVVIKNYEATEEVEEIIRLNGFSGEESEYILENDELLFTMDAATSQFTVTVKDTGKVWRSNPEGAKEDQRANPQGKGMLQSTLILTHSTDNGVDAVYDNYRFGMENQIYEIIQEGDTIRVDYTIGDVEREFVIPPVLTEDRYNEYYNMLEKSQQRDFKDNYKKYDINKLGKKDNKEELLARYPIFADTVIYALRDNTTLRVKNKLEQYFEAIGYTYEQYQEDKTLDQGEASSDKPVFNVSMVYRLDGKDLVVEVPFDSFEYKSENPVYKIEVLPNFGAGGLQDEGFMLVPEGGGALINFNNAKTRQGNYYANVYGWDMAQDRTSLVNETRASFAAFGVSHITDSFLCMIEGATPYAAVKADVSMKSNSFNVVGTEYTLLTRESYEMTERMNGSLYVYLPELPQDECIVQRYSFIDSGSYVDMANDYNEYLVNQYGSYFTMNTDTEAPVVVEIVGAIDKVKHVLGVPLSRPLELTNFTEAQSIIDTMYGGGMKNLSVKLTGWTNGGVRQEVLNKVKIVKDLGSKKELQQLVNNAKDKGIDFYLNGVTDYSYNSNILDGFLVFRDSARFLSRKKVELLEYDTITFDKSTWFDAFYLLKADLRGEMYENLRAVAAEYGAGVSFENIGYELSSDFNRQKRQSRYQEMVAHEERLKAMADAGEKVMINGSNDYAIAYADMISNMDMEGTVYGIIDKTVPFYQIAIHGYVNYVGEALNLTQNYQDELLRSAEYGAGLAFTLMDETAFTLQNTFYTEYFGANVNDWSERILAEYNRYNEELGHIFSQRIVGHEYLTDKVVCTTYADGTKVYVNYDFADYSENGTSVAARDYKVVR